MRSMTEGRDIRGGGRGHRAAVCLLAAIAAMAAAGCGGGQRANAGGPPPAAVEAVTLGNAPVERTSEFIGTVKSRRSTTIQPQVDGIIRRIAVASGARVTPGAVLLEIDAERQQASVATLQSQRAARLADLGLARQQAERARTLLDAGAGITDGIRPGRGRAGRRPRRSSRRSRSRSGSSGSSSATTG